jgi:DNA primase
MKDFLDTKHIIKMKMNVWGQVDQSDIIGAIFGQTEDVLGESLNLRELQRKNKIGRIEVELVSQRDKVVATVIIPSALDKIESVIIAAALETIIKIGPCKADALVESIEDIKRIKLREIIGKAKEVLQKFMSVSVDSQEIVDKVVEEVRKSQAIELGEDKLIAGPRAEKEDEITLVETKAELLNMLSQGIKNCIAIENKYDSKTFKEFAEKKVITALINRNREFIVRKLLESAEIDYITKPDFGRTVLEMQGKEIYKAIRGRVSTKQLFHKPEPRPVQQTAVQPRPAVQQSFSQPVQTASQPVPQVRTDAPRQDAPVRREEVKRDDFRQQPRPQQTAYAPPKEMEVFKKRFTELAGTQDASIIDKNLEVLGQVPIADLPNTIPGLGSKIFAIVINGKIPKDVVFKSERNRVVYLVGSETEFSSNRIKIILIPAAV